MKYCKLCLQPDTRPSIRFDEEGVCPACRFSGKHVKVDWDERHRELREIMNEAKEKSRCQYDCVIGVSGGKDSLRQAMFAKYEFGLNPLLVSCSYPPEQMTHRGAHNISNLISLGFDAITVSPAPATWKSLMRTGFLKNGNWARSTEMALYASAPRVAAQYGIPVVFLGENPALTVGELGVGSVNSNARSMKSSNTIAGGIASLIGTESDKKPYFLYQYPEDAELDAAQIKILYIGYYIPDFGKIQNGQFAIARGMRVRQDPPEDIGDLTGYEALDENFVVINQYFKFLKLGFGKVTDQVCEDIRNGRLTRDEGIDLVRRYDGKCADRYIKAFCDYLEISEEEFWEVADRFRNKDIWQKAPNGEWKLKDWEWQ